MVLVEKKNNKNPLTFFSVHVCEIDVANLNELKICVAYSLFVSVPPSWMLERVMASLSATECCLIWLAAPES